MEGNVLGTLAARTIFLYGADEPTTNPSVATTSTDAPPDGVAAGMKDRQDPATRTLLGFLAISRGARLW